MIEQNEKDLIKENFERLHREKTMRDIKLASKRPKKGFYPKKPKSKLEILV